MPRHLPLATFLAATLLLAACTDSADTPPPPGASATVEATPTLAAPSTPARSPTPVEATPTPAPTPIPLAALDLPAARILYQCDPGWCVIDPSEGTSTSLAGLPPFATFVTPSPSGALLAYYEHDTNRQWLAVAAIDGTSPRRLIELRPVHDLVPPAWSPDETTIYVERGPPEDAGGIGGDIDILAVDLASGAATLLVDTDFFAGGPQPSPDGSTVAYMYQQPEAGGGSGIATVPSSGGDPFHLTGDPTINLFPAWLPDGRIVFVASRQGARGSYELWLMDADGSNVTNLSNHPATDIVLPVGHFAPAVSPDGQWVAFQSDRSGTLELHIARADASEVRQFTVAADATAGVPAWSPDAAFLAYSATIEGRRGIWLTRIADGATAYLVDGRRPRWLPAAKAGAPQ